MRLSEWSEERGSGEYFDRIRLLYDNGVSRLTHENIFEFPYFIAFSNRACCTGAGFRT
jgi:hypothetical protein